MHVLSHGDSKFSHMIMYFESFSQVKEEWDDYSIVQ